MKSYPDKDWLLKAKELHGYSYDYSNVFCEIKTKIQGSSDDYSQRINGGEVLRNFFEEEVVVINCPEHGEFKVGEMEHLGIDIVTKCKKHRPIGCPICDQEKLTQDLLSSKGNMFFSKVQSFYYGSENFKIEFKNPLLPSELEYIMGFDIAGLQFQLNSCVDFIKGTPLFVKGIPEDRNEYDKNAIAIVGYDINEQQFKLGYLPAELAKFLTEERILSLIYLALSRATLKLEEKVFIELCLYGDIEMVKLFHKKKISERKVFFHNGHYQLLSEEEIDKDFKEKSERNGIDTLYRQAKAKENRYRYGDAVNKYQEIMDSSYFRNKLNEPGDQSWTTDIFDRISICMVKNKQDDLALEILNNYIEIRQSQKYPCRGSLIKRRERIRRNLGLAPLTEEEWDSLVNKYRSHANKINR